MSSLSRRLFAIQRALDTSAARPKVIEFGEWLPDRPDLANPGCTVAKNVVPKADGYGPFSDFSAVSTNSLTARCQGGVAVKDTSGNTHIFAGDATKLYQLTSTTFASVGGATYTTGSDSTWEFASFDNEVIATNFDDAIQGFTLGTDAAFSNLLVSSIKPKARHVGVLRDFLVLGNTNDTTDGAKPNRVWWSANGDPTDFDPDAATQCDFNDIQDAGWVQRVIGGKDFGLIFMERSLVRMTYIGGGLVFRFDTVEDARGTPIPNSVISLGRTVFYISEEGFLMTDGINSVPIGHAKVDKWFWDQFDLVNAHRLTAAIDPIRKLVMWAFPGSANVAGNPNTIIMFNWAQQKWAYAIVDTDIIFRGLSQGYTLDGLDAVTTDLDALSASLDSRAWTGEGFVLSAFNQSHTYGTFTGDNLAAVIETTEFQTFNDGLGTLQGVRPLVDAGTPTVAVAARNTPQATVTYGSDVAIGANGESPQNSTGRYHRARVTVPADTDFTHAQGVQIRAAYAGTD